MKYTNEKIRRQDRLLPQTEASTLLRNGEYGVLSMVGLDHGGYGIPINYVWDGEDSIYFHCAPGGEKLMCLAANGDVSFCVVGCTNVIPDKFTTQYESVMVKGKVCLTLTDQEKINALELIIDKFSKEHKEIGMKYIEKSLHRTAIIRLDIESISGKGKKI